MKWLMAKREMRHYLEPTADLLGRHIALGAPLPEYAAQGLSAN
jgi:hypothetical protein